jgi:hypothetical protein
MNLTLKFSTICIIFSMYFHNSNYHVRPKHALRLTSNNCQNLVVIDSPLMGYTVEQCAFLHESYVECGSPRVWQNVRENYIKYFPVSQFQPQLASIILLMNSGPLYHSRTRKLLEKLIQIIDKNLNGSQSHFK